ncbi:TrmH family RNA methyltransferase [Oerskovia sp. M15]
MQIIHVTDPADERLVDYTNLTDIELRSKNEPEKGMYIAESATVIHRALAAGHRPAPSSWRRSGSPASRRRSPPSGSTTGPAEPGTRPRVHRRAGGPRGHHGLQPAPRALAAMHRPVLPSVHELLTSARDGQGARRVAVLEDIVDHTNIGAIFRGAAGLGVDAVLVTPRCSDPLYRRSVRVSMGTVFQVPWTRLESWPGGVEELRGHGFTVAALALSDDSLTLDEYVARGRRGRRSCSGRRARAAAFDARDRGPRREDPDGRRSGLAQRRCERCRGVLGDALTPPLWSNQDGAGEPGPGPELEAGLRAPRPADTWVTLVIDGEQRSRS